MIAEINTKLKCNILIKVLAYYRKINIKSMGKGDELPVIPVLNNRQWTRKGLGAR